MGNYIGRYKKKILNGQSIKSPKNRRIKSTIRRKEFKPPKSREIIDKEILKTLEEDDRRLLKQIRKYREGKEEEEGET